MTKDSTDYTESFGKVSFTEAGTYTWTVTETHKGETINGVTYDSADKTVTIVVKDDGKGGLIAEEGSALVQTAAFENNYSAAGEGEIKTLKTLSGRAWTTDDSFEFTITPVGDAPATEKTTVTVTKDSANYTESFGKVKFTKAGTYQWTVTETHSGETIDGVAYDSADKTVTIVVVDDGKGNLVADTDSNLVQTAEFTNTYSKAGEGEIKVLKNLVGRAWTTEDSFEFKITPNGNAPATEKTTVTVTKGSANFTESFGKVTFEEAGTYTWTVSETHKGDTIDGVTYDSADKTVTIVVKDDGKGGLIAEEGSALVQTAAFTNNYSKSGEGEVRVKKNFTGRDWATNDSFEFTITPAGDNTLTFPNSTVTVTKDSANYTESFGKVTFTEAGTYQWTVTETHKGDTVDGITYDSADRTVTIVVKDDGKGHLVAEEGSALLQTAEFTNTYSKSGKGEIKVKKTFTGRAWTTEDSFEFTITPAEGTPATAKDTVTVTKGSANYTESFGEVTFTEAGTYTWTISETHKGETIDGISYDADDETVIIEVVDDGKGNLVAKEGSALVQTAEFENTYSKSGKGEIKVLKTLVGREWATDDSFEFTITPVDGAPATEKTKVTVTKDSTDYTESFGKVTFTEAGTYTWTVTETHKGETINGVTYDSADKTVTIIVKDDGKGGLTAEEGSALVQTAEFTNSYSKSGEGEIMVQKTLIGRNWATDDSFEFTITPAEGTPATKKTTVTVTKDSANFTESFGKVTFEEAGTYTWTISETHKGETIDGITYAGEDQTVTIEVVDDGKGNLVAKEGSALVKTAEFKNNYSASGEGEVKVKKTLTGRDWATGDSFEFTIEAVGDAPAFDPATVTVTKDSVDYTETFGKVTFTEAGTYQWKVTETHKGETIDGVTYDSTVKTVTIVVEDNGKGKLVASEGSNLVQTAEFENTYSKSGKGEVQVKKTFTGRDWTTNDSFEFRIVPQGNAPAFDPAIVTVTKDSVDYTETFGKVTFTEAGTYTWTVTETHKGETLNGISYDSADKTVTITVVDDGKGNLIADKDSALIQTAEFTNTYSKSGQGEVKVQKNLIGREWATDDSFEFKISPVGKAPAFTNDTVTVTKDSANYTESFGKVTFTEAGTYQWTVSETHKGETIDGVAYDSADKTVTIEVVDDGKGNLVAKEGSALVQTAEFRNTYSKSGEGEVKVKKTLTGREWTTNDSFEFTITPVGNAPAFKNNKVVVRKNSTDYTESFGKVTFTEAGTYQWTVSETHKGETLKGISYDSADKTVTIVVKDDGKGHLVATESSNLVQTAEFENTYSKSGTGEVKVQKNLIGRNWATDDSFEFTIKPIGNAPAFANNKVSVTKDSTSYTESFGTVTFTEAGTYQWKVTETHKSETIDGIAYDSADKTVTIKVVDDGEGNLVADEGSALIQTAEFTNRYSKSGTGEVKVKKTLTGREWATDDSFEFTIEAVGDAPAFDPATVTVTKDSANYTETFGTVTFTEAGTYQWKVTETHKGETIDGVAYDGADRTVTITVKDDGKGHLVPDEGSALVQTAEFGNSYSKSGEGEVKVRKNLIGRDWATDDSFEFTISPIGNAPAFSTASVSVTKNSADHTESFGKVTFTEAGTYQWTVTETHKGETIDGIAYDTTDKTVTIKVVDDGKGHLVPDEGSALVQTAAFENNYSKSGKGEVKVKKNLIGRDWATDDSFEFTIEPIGNAPEFANNTVTVTKDSTDYTETFGKVTFTEAGTYQWTVKETHKGEKIDGITYDATDKVVTIVVKDNGKGVLVAEEGSDTVQTAVFRNNYSKVGEGEVKVQKTLTGREWTEDDKFEFTIEPVGDAPEFDPATVTVTKDSVDYTETFGKVTFTEAGTYEWTVTETHKGETLKGVSYESTQKTVTITVKDNGKGNLIAVENSNLVQTAAFTNTYDASGEVTLGGTKTIENRKFTKNDKLTIVATTEDGEEAASATVQLEEGKTNASYTLSTINYTLDDMDGLKQKDFTYTVTEIPEIVGTTPKKVDHEVVVTVTDNYEGTLEITGVTVDGTAVESTDDVFGGIDFVNTYKAEGSIVFSGNKFIDKRDFVEGDTATMKIEPTDKNPDAPMPAEDTVTVNPTEKRAIPYSFGEIKYVLSDIPEGAGKSTTFEYKITESAFNMKGVVKDKKEYIVTVTVADSNTGNLTVTSVPAKDKMDFTNKVTTVKVKKTDIVDGAELSGALIQIIDKKTGEVVAVWTSDTENEAGGHVVEGLEVGKEYILHEEVAPLGYTVTTDSNFTIDEDNKVTYSGTKTEDEDGNEVLLIEDTMTEVHVKKTDIVTGNELPGAEIWIINKETKEVVAKWTSDDSEEGHVVKGLTTGVTYILHEEVAPEDYTITAETEFMLDKWGNVVANETVTTCNTETLADGTVILLVEDTSETMPASVLKIWDDEQNRDGIRPSGLTVTLMRKVGEDGKPEKVQDVDLTARDNWIATVTGLAKREDGKVITYYWTEGEVANYTLTNTGTSGTLTTLTNTHGPEKTTVTVHKVWDGGSDNRPDYIDVQLYADGVICGPVITLSNEKGWDYTWTDLYKYAEKTRPTAERTEILYTVEEVAVPEGYEASISRTSDGWTIRNTPTVGKLEIEKEFDILPPEETPPPPGEFVDIPVVKIWDDNNNIDGNRPNVITVHLFADGTETATAILTAEGGWTYTFVHLPGYNELGEVIEYTVTEDPVPMYKAEIHGTNIRNVYTPDLTAATVRKAWDDNNNAGGRRPLSVSMSLSNGTRTVATVVLSTENNWEATVENLPTVINGQPAVYTWTEQEVIGYRQTGIATEGTVTTITNSRWPVENPNAATPLRTPGETWYLFEEYETPLGVEVIINHVGDCFD